jgi:hypothetical protein
MLGLLDVLIPVCSCRSRLSASWSSWRLCSSSQGRGSSSVGQSCSMSEDGIGNGLARSLSVSRRGIPMTLSRSGSREQTRRRSYSLSNRGMG